MGNELMNKINLYLKNNTRRKHLYQILLVLCVAIAFLVYSIMTKPAISMAFDNINVESMRENTSFGQVVPVRVTAEALEGNDPTNFVIYTEGVGGGLSSEYQFDQENICEITAEDGKTVKLHKEDVVDEESGDIVKHNYWFTLQPEEKVAFTLNYTSDVEAISTPSSEGGSTEVEVPSSEEQSSEETGSSTEATTEGEGEGKDPETPTTAEGEEEGKDPETPTTAEGEEEGKDPETPTTAEGEEEGKDPETPTTAEGEEEGKDPETPTTAEGEEEGKDPGASTTTEGEGEGTGEEANQGGTTTENVTEDNETKTPVTIEQKDEESTGASTTKTKMEQKKVSEDEDFVVSNVNSTTFNKIALANVEYIDTKDTKSMDLETPTTLEETASTEKPTNTEQTGNIGEGTTGTQAETETSIDGEEENDDSDVTFVEEKADQYLNIYVAASANEDYEGIANALVDRVSSWDGVAPNEEIENKKVASLYWTKEENTTDVVIKGRTKEGVLVTVTSDKTAFDETQLKDISLVVEEIQVQDEIQAATSVSGTTEQETETTTKTIDELLKEALGEESQNLLERRRFDIKLMANNQEIEPSGNISVTFDGMENTSAKKAKVFHIQDKQTIQDMNASFNEDGTIRMETDHLSEFEVVFLGSNELETTELQWNEPSGKDYLGGAGQFNAFLFGDLKNIQEVEGSLAVQGNMEFAQDFLAAESTINTTSQLQLDIYPISILFGGDTITVPEGNQIVTAPLSEDNDSEIWLDGTKVTKDQYDIFTEYSESGKLKNATNIKEFFEEAKVSLEKQSETLSNKKESKTTAIVQAEVKDNTLKFAYDGEATEIIFEVDSKDLCDGQIQKWTMNIPDDAMAILNVKGEGTIAITPMFEKKSMDSYVDLGRRVLWNFKKGITNVALKGNNPWMGSILAPNTDFDTTDFTSTIDGTIIVNDFGSEAKGNVSCTYFPLRNLEKVDQVKKEQLTAIHITKEWEDEKIEKTVSKVDVSIYNEKEEKVAQETLKAENDWSVTIKNLPMYDENGDVIQYKIVEEVDDSSLSGVAEYSGQEEVWAPVDTFIDGQKHLLIGEEENGELYVFNSSDLSEKVELTEEQLAQRVTKSINTKEQNCWLIADNIISTSYSWKIESVLDSNGEMSWDLQTAKDPTNHLDISDKELTFNSSGTPNYLESNQLFTTNEETNIYINDELETSTKQSQAASFKILARVLTDQKVRIVPTEDNENKMAEIHVQKSWEDGDDTHKKDEVQVQLYWREKNKIDDETAWKTNFNEENTPILVNETGDEIDSSITLSDSGNWEYTWYASNSDALGNAYEYKVEEIKGVDGYMAFVNESEELLTIFTPVSSAELKDDETYAIISDEGYILGVDYYNESVFADQLNSGENGTWIASSIDEFYEWNVTKENSSNDSISLQNEGNQGYLTIDNNVTISTEPEYLIYEGNGNTSGKLGGIDSKRYIKISKLNTGRITIRADRESGSQFKFYKIKTFTKKLDVSIANNKVQLGSNTFPHTKQIDYLGDEGKDSDDYTKVTNKDAYRLYLDLASNPLPQSVDVVFVIDKSASMGDPISSSDEKSRISAVIDQVTKLAKDIEKNSADEEDINKNRMSIISFSEDATIENFSSSRNWTYDSNEIINKITEIGEKVSAGNTGQTNTILALNKLQELLQQDDSGRKKYVFFLTDGAPTCYYEKDNDNWIMHKEGNDLEAQRQTISYAQTVKSELSDKNVTIYSVGISKDTEVDNAKEVLNAITTIPGSMLYATDTTTLDNIFDTLLQGLSANNLSITDTLSQYVDLNEKADITITMKERTDIKGNCTDQKEIVLWSGQWDSEFGEIEQTSDPDDNEVTGHMKDKHGDKNEVGTTIIDSVDFTPNTKQIKVTFNPEYLINKDYVYTLSFNVVLSDGAKALTEYPENMIGDKNTDYKNNKTSDNKKGLFANAYSYNQQTGKYEQSTTGVNIGYTIVSSSGEEQSKMIEGYTEKPVVQIPESYSITIQKLDMDNVTKIPGVAFDLYRIDEEGTNLLEEKYDITDLVIKVNKQTLETDQDGKITLTKDSNLLNEKLMDGTYYLVETKAASEYVVLKPVKFQLEKGNLKIDPSSSMIVDNGSNNYSIQFIVKNSKTVSLPVTGGMGTSYFTILGIMTMTIAVVGMISIRKRQSYNEER